MRENRYRKGLVELIRGRRKVSRLRSFTGTAGGGKRNEARFRSDSSWHRERKTLD